MSVEEDYFKKALLEASVWDAQATQMEKSTIPASEARLAVLDRIFNKYKNKMFRSAKIEQIFKENE